MKLSKLALSTIISLSLLGCSATSDTQATSSAITPEQYSSTVKGMRKLAHKIVSRDSSFESSMKEFMPHGIKQISEKELRLSSVFIANGEVAFSTYKHTLSSFEIKKLIGVSRSEIIRIIGSPSYDNTEYNAYSYNGSKKSFITFAFNKADKVKRI